MKKAVAYLRVSGKSQLEGDGLSRQERKIQEWSKARGVEVVSWYRDEGVSGTLADRPELGRMLVELEENHTGVEWILLERLDRLARDLYIQESILRDLWRLGREVVPVDSGIPAKEDDDPTRKLIRQILGAVAEFEKEIFVLKTRASRQRIRLKKGKCEGRKAFGFYPGESDTLERIKDLRRKRGGERLSYSRIAAALNTEARETRQGSPWRASSVQRIVKAQFPALA